MKRNKELKLDKCRCGNTPQTTIGWSDGIKHLYGYHVVCRKCKVMTEIYCSKRESQREWNKGNILYPTKWSRLVKMIFKNKTLKYKSKK